MSVLLWTASVVLVVSAAIAAIVAITERQAPHGDSRSSGLLGAAIFLIVGLGLGALARRHGHHSGAGPSGLPFSEHLGSGRRSSASTDALASTIGLSSSSTGSTGTGADLMSPGSGSAGPVHARRIRAPRRARTSRRKTPLTRRGALIQAGVFSALVALMIVLCVTTLNECERSSYTQSHGVLDQALLGEVINTQHCGRSSCSYTFAAPVALQTPVSGTSTSTVHGRGKYAGNEMTEVVVDPKDPSYAELPGEKLDSSGAWIVFAVIAAFFALIAGLMIRVSFNLPARRA